MTLSNNGTTTQNEPQFVESFFKISSFDAEISDKKIVYQIIQMMDSLMIFVNDKENNSLVDLSLAMKNRYENMPVATQLLGQFGEEQSKILACKLSKKLNQVVYLSFNLDNDRLLVPEVEKKLFEEIKNHPEKF